MRRLICWLCAAWCASAPVLAADDGAGPVERTLEAWAASWNAGSVEKMLAFYEDSGRVVAIASSGVRYDGIAGVRRMYREAFDEAAWERVWLEKLKVSRVLNGQGDLAWATCWFRAEFVPAGGKERLEFTSQGTLLLLRRDGAWKIALEHFSPIAGVPRVRAREE